MTDYMATVGQADIVTMLQTAMAPAFLLVALGAILTLFAARLARIIDRSRVLQELFGETEGTEHQIIVSELHDLQLRIKIVNNAIFLGVIGAILVCVLIGLLFTQGFVGMDLSGVIALAFVLAVSLLSVALIQFLREVRIGSRDFMIREEFLEREEPSGRPIINRASPEERQG